MRRKLAEHSIACLLAMTVAGGTATAEPCYQDSEGRIVTRRRPGFVEVPCPEQATPATPAPAPAPAPAPVPVPAAAVPEPAAAPVPTAAPAAAPMPVNTPGAVTPVRPAPGIPRPRLTDYVQAIPVPDRWRIVETLGETERWWDPYNRNVLKGDRPISDGDKFFHLGLISDTSLELRSVPTPVGGSTTRRAGALDTFGGAGQSALVQYLAADLIYYKGDTVFQPPDYELHFTPVLNYNGTRTAEIGVLNADPRKGATRNDGFLGIQAAFVDLHLRNASEHYDFDSFRLGIQPFSADFRGFLFQDNQLGARFFGTRSNNIFQYNLAWFRRLEKDTNSGLNDLLVRPRNDDVVVANLYWQDFPVAGFKSQATVVFNRNRENQRNDIHYDKNGFLERPASLGREQPRGYDVVYLGYNGDGHFGRLNLTTSLYYATGQETAGTFVSTKTRISALFGAAESSIDFDWIRVRASGLYGSGDRHPYDNRATGFDAILENPQFAGAGSSYWIRQAVPLIGGGGVALSGRNGVLANLRPSKDEGQSNFTNPGIILAGVGVDLDLLPTLRLSANANTLYFDSTAVLEALRSQGKIDRHVGYDLSVAFNWRPFMSQNLVLRTSFATLVGGAGWRDLYAEKLPCYFLVNAIVTY